MTVRMYEIEGYADYRSDFSLGVVIARPIVGYFDALSVADVIENFCIDASMGEFKDEDDPETRRRIQNSFYKARKKSTADLHYWKVVVEVDDDPNSHWVYHVLDAHGLEVE